MHNVSHEVKGDLLIITIDISDKTIKAAPRSASGKTFLVASTGMSIPIACKHAPNLNFSVNVMNK
jgi:hypothetical protein